MLGIWIFSIIAVCLGIGILTAILWGILRKILSRPKAINRCAIGLFTVLTTLISYFVLNSIVLIGSEEVGVVEVHYWPRWTSLPPGRLIAMKGEIGLQAELLEPGLHFWPAFLTTVSKHPVTEIPQGSIGILESLDGKPLPRNVRASPQQWTHQGWYESMSFLNSPHAYRGIQNPPLSSGKHRLHPYLFRVIEVDSTLRMIRFGDRESEVTGSPPIGRLEEIQTSANGVGVNIHLRVNYQVTPDTAYKTIPELGPDFEEALLNLIISTARTSVREVIQPLDLHDLLDNRNKYQDEIMAKMDNLLIGYGVELKIVGFTSIYPPIGPEGDDFRSIRSDRARIQIAELAASANQREIELDQETAILRLQGMESEQRVSQSEMSHQNLLADLAIKSETNVTVQRAEAYAEAASILGQAEQEDFRLLVELLGAENASMVISIREASKHGIDLLPDVILSNDHDTLSAFLINRFTLESGVPEE